MKHMVFLFLLMAGGFFGWRYLMKLDEKRLVGKWGWRAVLAVTFGAIGVVGLFAVLTINSWKFF
jgi:hypothetical protein